MTKKIYGLIGFPLSHSFSPVWFKKFFESNQINDTEYKLFPLHAISELPQLIENNPELKGLNVTIPYKSEIIPYLHETDSEALEINAVNCIRIRKKAHDQPFLKGFNTDITGFEKSLTPLLKPPHHKALIFGTGGSSKAVIKVLNKLNIDFLNISRSGKLNNNILGYQDLNKTLLKEFKLWINTTPLGMYPDTDNCLPVDFEQLTSEHLVYDLIYNPSETLFLKNAKTKGAVVKNGMEMLEIQALESAKIFGLI